MKNLKYRIVFLFAFLISSGLSAQIHYSTTNKKAIKLFEEGLEYFQKNEMENCENSLLKAVSGDSTFLQAHMLLAQIYDEQQKYLKAIYEYKKVTELSEKFDSRAFYALALNQYYAEKYDDALTSIKQFMANANEKDNLYAKAKFLKKNCDFAAWAIKNPVPFNPINLGDSVNSIYDDYSPTLTVDEQTLIITVAHPKDENTITGSKLEEDFFLCQKDANGRWSKAMKMKPPLNSHGNEGAQSISPDGKSLYFTICNRSDGLGSCDIYSSEKSGNQWSAPVNLGIRLNSPGWDSEPSISPDGKTLYFSSSRGGGKGNADIWKSTKNEFGEWETPENLGDSINTAGKESSPFMHFDGKTLFFLSDGLPGMGRTDIFYSRLKEDGTWSTAKNIGYPINTVNQEGFFIVNARGTTAYYSSDKPGGVGKLDLYSFDVPVQARPVPVTYMKGRVYDKNTLKPLLAAFELYDIKTAKVVASSQSDPLTGEFLVSVPTDREYALNVVKEGFLFYSENISFKGIHTELKPFIKDIAMVPIQAGNVVVMKNIFFDFDKSDLKDESLAELATLLDLMTKNPKMCIEIGGHTDNKGTTEYNSKLSEARSKAVYDYLISKGVAKNRLSYKGYGATKPIDSNDTEECRANNRRTEFKVVSN